MAQSPPPSAACKVRRRLLAALPAFGLLTLQGCTPPAPLVIAAHTWPGYEFMFLARDLGWLGTSGVSLTRTSSATESIRELEQGRVDGAALTLDEVLRVRASGTALTIVLVFDISAGADVVLARGNIEALPALRGRRIGVESGTVGALMLRKLMVAAELQDADIIAEALPADEHLGAWQAGRLDAIVTYEPTATLIEQTGARRIFDSRMFPPLVIDVLAVRREILHARRDDLRALARAHFRALRHFTRHRLDAAHRLAARMKLPPEGVLDTYRGLELPDVAQNRDLLGGTAPRLAPTLAEVSRLMLELGSLPHADKLAGIVSDVALPQGNFQ